MKKIIYLFFSIFLINCDEPTINLGNSSVPTFTETVDFIKTFGGSKNESAQSVVKTSDGGYAVLGYAQSNDFDITDKTNESYDFWLLKFSSEDEPQWSKTYGGTSNDRGFDLVETTDGNFAIFGYSESNDEDVSTNAGSRDFWVAKVSINGNLLWQKSFGYSGNDYGISLIKTNDNGLLLTGVLDVSASGGQGNSRSSTRHAGGDFWAIKLNSNGNKEWSRYYGGSFTDTPNGIAQTSDGSFIFVGSSDSNDVDINNNKGTYDFWVIKTAANGTLVWQKNFGGTEIDEARAITPTNDGNFVIVGDTRSSDTDITNNNGGAELWVLKISTNGELIWQKTFGGTAFDVARSVSKTRDNGFLISGSSRSSDGSFVNKGQNDAWILKISSEGNREWQKFVGGSEIDFCYDAVELNNGSVIAVGESYSNNQDILENKGFSDLLIIKIK